LSAFTLFYARTVKSSSTLARTWDGTHHNKKFAGYIIDKRFTF